MANLGFVQHERPGWQDRAKHYLDLVGLSHCADRYPSQLSGGQQQRIGIARAFAVEPDVLLMDEPFSHLDAMTSRTLREHLERIWLESRRTVMFVTHDVTEAVQLSDRIVVLEPGGRIHEIIDVDLPRPRKASDPAVAVLQAEVLARFEALESAQVREKADIA
jgi:NitT/TauT family transport system ATP-binding protein